jgi:hypothetical protein
LTIAGAAGSSARAKTDIPSTPALIRIAITDRMDIIL